MKTLLFALAAIAVVATPVSAQYGGFGWGVVGSSTGTPTQMDSCPNGDYSSSFYDGTCGTAPSGDTLVLGDTSVGTNPATPTTTTPTGETPVDTTTSTNTDSPTTDTTASDETKDALTLGQFNTTNTEDANAVNGSMNLPGMLPKTGSEVSYVIFALFAMMSVFGLRLIK